LGARIGYRMATELSDYLLGGVWSPAHPATSPQKVRWLGWPPYHVTVQLLRKELVSPASRPIHTHRPLHFFHIPKKYSTSFFFLEQSWLGLLPPCIDTHFTNLPGLLLLYRRKH